MAARHHRVPVFFLLFTGAAPLDPVRPATCASATRLAPFRPPALATAASVCITRAQ